MQFEQFSLDPRIVAGVKTAGYAIPTPIQPQAIPVVLQKRDILGWRRPAPGKRPPFCCPSCSSSASGRPQHARGDFWPTRELVEQIHDGHRSRVEH